MNAREWMKGEHYKLLMNFDLATVMEAYARDVTAGAVDTIKQKIVDHRLANAYESCGCDECRAYLWCIDQIDAALAQLRESLGDGR